MISRLLGMFKDGPKDVVFNHREEFDLFVNLSVCFFGMIRFLIFDPRSHGSWHIKGTDKSTLNKDSSAPLMRHDPCDFGSKIQKQIIPKKHTLRYTNRSTSSR